MTKGEFIRDLYLFAKERPEYIRFGQFIFNYIEETYGVARDVQFIDKVDCFYVDENVDKFIDCAYKRIFSYLTIEALEDGLTAILDMTDDNEPIEYCIDEGEWITLKSGEKTQPINKGQKLSFKGERKPSKYNDNNIGRFTISKKCNLKGNCMSLLFGDNANKHTSLEGYTSVFSYLFAWCYKIVEIEANFLPATTLADKCYHSMFQGCTSLVNAPDLPSTTLAKYCYSYMFEGCTSLVNAPELPATTLAKYCYEYMFMRCTSLVTAPELPATTLANGCYYEMFKYCSKLNNITMLATDISASNCLTYWVSGVALTGTLIKSPSMDNILYLIPEKWTIQDYK